MKSGESKTENKTETPAEVKPTGLALLRAPFEKHQISKLPKPTKAQTDEVKNDFQKGIRCPDCGAWHHPKVVHLDYVGHAALTDRLLDVDEKWEWTPLAFDTDGLPKFDKIGGLWIKLTVCGVTRYGYGNTDKDSTDGNAEKEIIGDALRNAAMRFGAALDLWHKGDLHKLENEGSDKKETSQKQPETKAAAAAQQKAQNQNPLDYVVTFGKFKGKALKDISMDDIAGYVSYLEKGAATSNKPLTGAPLEFVQNSKKVLEAGADPVGQNLNEDIPF